MASEQLDAAMSHWRAGDLDQAAALFREIAATGDPEASHLLAGLLQEQGDLDGAEAAHRAVIQSGDPVFGQRSAMAMGMMLVNAKEWAAAHRVLMIASDGADFEVAALADTALVLVCTQLGDAAGAQEALERARRCDSPAVAELAARLELPEFPPAQAPPQELYAAAETEDDYRALLTCGDPEVVSLAAFQLYRMYADAGDFAEARAVCEHAIAVGHPGHRAMAHNLLGAVLVDLGEYAESAAAYRVAAEHPDPEVRLPSLIELAKVTAQLGDDEETKAIFNRVIASGHHEHALEAQACLAQLHTEAGESAPALAAIRAVLEAGESEWSSACVTLLGMLLEQRPEARDEVMELAGLAAGNPDPDTAFKATLLLEHEARRQPLEDPVAEQALNDVDEGLARLREGDLAGARRLLRGAADSGAPVQAPRAMVALAGLELREGDPEQADELLTYVAEGDDVPQGFQAAVLLQLLHASGDEPHPVLNALLDHQWLGRDDGLNGYRAATEHLDPAVAALGTAVFAHVLVSTGYDPSEAAELFLSAASSGDPLALSYAAVLGKEVLSDRRQATELLERAHACGHPALAPWVGATLGGLVAGDDPGRARAAYESVLEGPHRGLRMEAAAALADIYERQGDLLAACRLHERLIAEGETERAALPLAVTRLRLDDVAGARAALDLGTDELSGFGRLVLDRDFGAAARAMPEGEAGSMATRLAIECASAWRRLGEFEAADGALTLAVESGHPAPRQHAACLLGALRSEAGDPRGAVMAYLAGAGEDEELDRLALRAAGELLHDLGEHDEAVTVLSRLPGDDRDAALLLGRALVDAGRVPEALERLTAAFGGDGPVLVAERLHERGDAPAALATLIAAARETASQDTAAQGTASQDAASRDAASRDAASQGAVSEKGAPERGAGVRGPWRVPATARAERLLGVLLAETGELEEAKAAFERAAALEPGSEAETMLAAGRSLRAAGDGEAAEFALERAAALADAGAESQAGAVARWLLGRAEPGELPWVLDAEGDRAGAEAALAELTGSRPLAALLFALRDGDVARVHALLAGIPLGPERDEAVGHVLDVAGDLDGDRAERLLRLLAADGEARAAFELGALLAGDGDHCRSELWFLRAAEHPETAAVAWHDIAIVRHRRGDLDGAVEAALTGLPRTGALAARLLQQRGEPERAREVLAGAAASGDLESRRELLALLVREQDHDALEAEAALAVESGDPETAGTGHWARGSSLALRGRKEEAAAAFARGVETAPGALAAALRVDLAGVLEELGDRTGAERELRLAAASGHPAAAGRAGVRLGVLAYEDGDLGAAAEAFALALGTPVDDLGIESLTGLAHEACERGEHAPAQRALALLGERAADTARALGGRCADPEAVPGYFALAGTGPYAELEAAQRLAELGEKGRARETYERLSRHEDPDVRFVADGRLLELLEAEGDTEAVYSLAERQARDAESPARGVFGGLLGMLQEQQGDLEASLRTLREAARDGDPTALTLYAQRLVDAGQVDEGREVYLRVVESGDAGLAVRAMIALGQTYHDEDAAQARAWYRRAADEADGHVSALAAMYLGALAKRERDFPEALTWYQRVIDSGDSESGLAAAHLGELCYWLGDRDGALRFYELTLELSEQAELVAEAACRMGEIRYERGDLDLARALLTRAVETGDPSFAPEAEVLLGKIG
ncbi:tetratricopeptide repeat protein [Nonomuraea sp. NPDC049309]|uniref:tetratricopeptide repeat protein n=1 Tax=Nonomuraea sp. NPDC049309 TaxID=3364350 RepID=UPI00371F56BB